MRPLISSLSTTSSLPARVRAASISVVCDDGVRCFRTVSCKSSHLPAAPLPPIAERVLQIGDATAGDEHEYPAGKRHGGVGPGAIERHARPECFAEAPMKGRHIGESD